MPSGPSRRGSVDVQIMIKPYTSYRHGREDGSGPTRGQISPRDGITVTTGAITKGHGAQVSYGYRWGPGQRHPTAILSLNMLHPAPPMHPPHPAQLAYSAPMSLQGWHDRPIWPRVQPPRPVLAKC